MTFRADLHIHSPFSYATSKYCLPESNVEVARQKGISLLGTGDALHPQWRGNVLEKLIPVDDGIYKINKTDSVNFMLTCEISSIYKRGGKTRKVHVLIMMPEIKHWEMLAQKLGKHGKITGDGRPILKLDMVDLIDITLNVYNKAIIIPAHIWTPWYAMFGSKSGFDTIEEALGDYAKYVHAIETGLSSDQEMNRRVSQLDRFSLVSFSDAHSTPRIGRNATVFPGNPSFEGIFAALKNNKVSTIDIFPEAGKYHYDGHRKCEISMTPDESRNCGGICPVCGKPLTRGVSSRVEELADRKEVDKSQLKGTHFLPLPMLVSEFLQVGENSKKVQRYCLDMQQKLGSELDILLTLDLKDIQEAGFAEVAQRIKMVRENKLKMTPGFDGVYGRVTF